jgi:hypothetical protein
MKTLLVVFNECMGIKVSSDTWVLTIMVQYDLLTAFPICTI